MAARIPVKAIYSGADVTSLGEFTSSDTIAGSYLTDGSVTAAKLAADTATQAELDVVSGVANAALPKAGGTMTGNLVMGTSLVDGIDISARDAVLTSTTTTAGAALPKAGGTMTGNLVMGTNLVDGIDISARDAVLTSTTTTAAAAMPKAGGAFTAQVVFGDNIKAKFGDAADLEIYHDGNDSIISDVGDGDLILKSNGANILLQHGAEKMIKCVEDAQVNLYYDNALKIATSPNGVTVTGGAVGTMTTDNDGSFAMSASNNFKCTPAGNFALTFTAIVAQSGNILFINSGGHTISAHANTKVDANFLATISTAGTYLLAYFSDGTNVYMTNSAIYT